MKTIFDDHIRNELIDRISSLHENSARQWGKMNIYQMMKHCTAWDEWVLGVGDQTYKQSFLGLIFGKLALKSEVWTDKPMKKGMPAGMLAVKEGGGDVELQKKKWIQRTGEFANFSNSQFIHDFFGRMTKEEIGILAYKHADHHLRQFNA